MKKKILITLFALAFVFRPLFSEGIRESSRSTDQTRGTAKYVFLFVGDGMSIAQITATEYYLAARDNNNNYNRVRLSFSGFPVAGIMNTHDYRSIITDSASAGTAFATGRKTISGMINVDPSDRQIQYKTIAEYAQEAGMRIGIVSNVTLTHATPAAFYAKVNHRNNTDGNENEPRGIAQQLVESGFDYFAGGWIVSNSENNDRWLAEAGRQGYTVTRTAAAFNALNRNSGKVIALAERVQDSGVMHYEIDRAPADLSLADFTRKGIELLENPNGFFMMIESGKIDGASHANDAGTVIHDILALDDAVKEALQFYNRYPNETLILVISDHDTGGMSIGWAGTGYSMYLDRIARQTRSYVAFNEEIVKPYKARVPAANRRIEDLYSDIFTSFGIDLRPDSLNISQFQRNQIEIAFRRSMEQTVAEPQEGWGVFHSSYEPLTVKLTQIMNQSAGIGWTSYAHTAIPVANFAIGAGQELFTGYYDNTDIFFKLAEAMKLSVSR